MVDIPENKREKLIQFIKFGLVGVSNNLICYGTYVLLINIGLHYVPSNIIGFSISVFNAFYWNNKYVFSDSDGSRVWWKTFIKTYISYAGTDRVSAARRWPHWWRQGQNADRTGG